MKEHLIGAVDTLSNANYYDLFANGIVSAKNIVSRISGTASDAASGNASVGAPLQAQVAATGGIKTGVINTQGVSLRDDDSTLSATRAPGSSIGARLARAIGIDAGKVEKVVEAKTGPGFGKVSDGNAGRTFYLGEGTSLR